MDAADDDGDIHLQRASADLLADLEKSLKPFLWKTTSSGKTKVRRRVRLRETDRLVNLLEPFQELPQLLDPYLEKLVPVLAQAFLVYLQSPPPKSRQTAHSQLLIPLSRSICRLMYTFCKIRGEKVIVRFLSTETRHLELLLSAIEAGSASAGSSTGDVWGWEERYIALLWLSQLLLAPFDLASISSADTVDTTQATIPRLQWPENVPAVALRVIPLSIRYLSSSGKERDAAKILLVRIAMRRDMQELGILQALISWAILELQSTAMQPAYHYIGILSFISGILVSSIGTTDVDRFLPSIFQLSQSVSEKENIVFQTIHNSAVAHKTVIKVLRSIAVLDLSSTSDAGSERVEWIIGSLLEYLSDPATPVRLAASKALSLITLKLGPEMAAQVVEAVVDSLAASVKWLEPPVNGRGFEISNTNPQEWHGLILTLSHLLYRRSVSSSALGDILSYLAIGLSFEQRSTSGSSIGTNVRDASCFGIWALARRYGTAELKCVVINPASLGSAVPTSLNVSALQRLATELVVSGCLDPAGNIRRGASAALQELIGRHPDIIDEGIKVVQVVDYHAVALRSRAVQETAPQAAQLSPHYYEGLKLALLGWRGVEDNDVFVRRYVASGFGNIIRLRHSDVEDVLHNLHLRLEYLPRRETGKWHGLVLCFASFLRTLSEITQVPELFYPRVLANFGSLLDTLKAGAASELGAESASRLFLAAYPIIRVEMEEPYSRDGIDGLRMMIQEVLGKLLASNGDGTADVVSEAAVTFLPLALGNYGCNWIQKWVDKAKDSNSDGEGRAYIRSLFKVYSKVPDFEFHKIGFEKIPPTHECLQNDILAVIQARWSDGHVRHHINTCTTILSSLADSSVILEKFKAFVNIIEGGLDDYTTDARGDIGSLLRIDAAKAAAALWKTVPFAETLDSSHALFGKVLRVAVDKLDKVRLEGHKAIACAFQSTFLSPTLPQSFTYILEMRPLDDSKPLRNDEAWMCCLFEGYVVSANAGSEDVVRASRAALVGFCAPENINLVCQTLFSVMRQNSNNDKILISAMETLSFLYDMGIAQKSNIEMKSLFMFIQTSHFQTKNVKKLEAAVKLYRGMSEVYPPALSKLTSLLLHAYPTIRNMAVEELFVVKGVGKGFNWGKGVGLKKEVEKVRHDLV